MDVDKILKLISNNYFIALFMSFFSIIALFNLEIIPVYNLFSWLLFCILYIYFSKINIKKNIKYIRGCIVISLIFSILSIVGNTVYNNLFNSNLNFIREIFKFSNFLNLLGLTSLFFSLLIILIPKLCRINSNKFFKGGKSSKGIIIFIISMFLIFIAWLPYFLAYYPGTLTYDSFVQLDFVVNKFKFISDHHPVLHTIFIAIPYYIGSIIFNTSNSAVALVTIVQMLIMAAIFAYLVYFLYKRNIRLIYLIIILLYFMFVPIHGFHSITMWKDVIFAGSVLLLTIQTIKMFEKNEITLKNSIGFILISLLNIFFRNNAIYAYIILTIFTFIIFKRYYKQLICIFLIIYSVYFGIKGPVFNYFNISHTESAEYISIPLQQIGRMAWKDIDFNKKEEKLINQLIPIDTLKDVYNPIVVDPIKLNENYNSDVFNKNKLQYLKLWITLVRKHPDIALESYFISTLGYWYPNVKVISSATWISNNEIGVYRDSKISTSIFDNLLSHDYPFINIFNSLAIVFWVIGIFMYITKKRLGRKHLYCFIPVIGIWITIMLSVPAYAEFRYIYSAYTTIPLLMVVPYFKSIK